MERQTPEEEEAPGDSGGNQVYHGISLVVTEQEVVYTPTEELPGDHHHPQDTYRNSVPPPLPDESLPSMRDDDMGGLKRNMSDDSSPTDSTVNYYHGGSGESKRISQISSDSTQHLSTVRHLSVEEMPRGETGDGIYGRGLPGHMGSAPTRRLTVHSIGTFQEDSSSAVASISTSSNLRSDYHSCNTVDEDSSRIDSHYGDNRHHRSESELMGKSTSSEISQLHLTAPKRITSVSSCCSLGQTESTENLGPQRMQRLDERSTKSDPANVNKDESIIDPHPQPRQAHSEQRPMFPGFTRNTGFAEELSILKHFRPKALYGSSYRGLVCERGGGGGGGGDKDNVETGSISTMRTVQYEDMDQTPAWRIGIEIVGPFLVAGFGMICAGLLLDSVQHWAVFVHVSEVFILVPALLGLKGNLEMTLASRLSTQANLGHMDSSAEQWKMIVGNLALTQAQAIVVGFLAAMAAMILGWIPEGKFDINHGFLLCCSSVLTAAFASFVLGTVMIVVVVLSRKCHVNPDNVATPIAASLGDLITLALLSGISSLMYKAIDDNQLWLAPTLLFLFLGMTPIWCVVSYRNKYTKEILYTGWTPVIGAMVISSIGGLILDFAVGNYHGIAVFQPVINGVGGNLVAVQASRLSTALHRISTPGNLPEGSVTGCPNIFKTFFGSGVNARTARVLLLMVVPGHLIFMYTIHYMQAGHTSITLIFAVIYLTAASLQVLILLYLANWLVHILWKRGNDPDNFSIPYLTALGDLLGGGLLALAFHILYVIGDRDADVGD